MKKDKLPDLLEEIFEKSTKSYPLAKRGDGQGNATYRQLEMLIKRQQIIIKRLVDVLIKLERKI
jgi:hypothetical protein